ncbi:disease susceptibility protein LOV1 [Prunus yedoensis var. nudiflora]|uniref:Disease susceptibility protein LOV1 n=1 Tax=Prunus yedoensis var. nudiflora TaxID=2094558 RepID=A0A314U5L3_PRUYE|nr:disease susceptibility protein LOV1 [Prunus yedoensis var. nudiflora]
MAAEVVVSVVMQKLTNLLVQESTISDEMIDQAEGLRIRYREMQRYLRDAESKQESYEDVRKWMAEFLGIAYDLEDFVDIFVLERTRRRRSSFIGYVATLEGPKATVKLCREMKEIEGKISDYMSKFSQINQRLTLPMDTEPILPEDLPSHLRPCLMYLGMFPKEVGIPVRRLFHLWLAEGFVKQSPGMSPEDLVEEYLAELVGRKMIFVSSSRSDGSAKTCRMSEKLWDVLSLKAEEIGLFYIHGKLASRASASSVSDPKFAVRRVVEHADIKDYPGDVKTLRSYISFNTQKKDLQAIQIGKFVRKIIGKRGYALLRVLDLEGVYKPQLPEELGFLYHLRYLGLRWTFSDALPTSVGHLPYLETLDVKHTYIRTLASTIWKMKLLRHLYLNDIRLDKSVHTYSTNPLTQLQTLWGLLVDKKTPVKDGLNRLVNLRKLGLTCHSISTEEIGQWILRLTGLRSLKLRCKNEIGEPSSLHLPSLANLQHLTHVYLLGRLPKLNEKFEFPPQLRVLTLSVSKLEDDPMPKLAQLKNLSVLRLLANSYTGKKMDCPEGGFGSLRVLRLWMLENLEEWEVAEGAMKNLQELEIRCCSSLKAVPDRVLKSSTFEKLNLINMPLTFVADCEAKKQEKTTMTKETWEF